MTAQVWPVTDSFAAEIGDVDLSQPLSDDDWATIENAYNTYSVLVFPDQHLGQDQHLEFARRFGPIDRSMVVDMDSKARVTPEIADVSNLNADGEVMAAGDRMLGFQRGNRLWHTDSSFKPTPANASLLYMQAIPPVGGMTNLPTFGRLGCTGCGNPGVDRQAVSPSTPSPPHASVWALR